MIIYSAYLTPHGDLIHKPSSEQITRFLATGEGLLWVDMEDAMPEEEQFLLEVFNFHPLALEDCISKEIHPPKVDEFEDHLFIIVHGINYHAASDILETTELGIFLGKNYVVSIHFFYAGDNLSLGACPDRQTPYEEGGRLPGPRLD